MVVCCWMLAAVVVSRREKKLSPFLDSAADGGDLPLSAPPPISFAALVCSCRCSARACLIFAMVHSSGTSYIPLYLASSISSYRVFAARMSVASMSQPRRIFLISGILSSSSVAISSPDTVGAPAPPLRAREK